MLLLARAPLWVDKTGHLRRFRVAGGVDLNLRFWYTYTGRRCLPPATIAPPLGHCEVV
jgi:hypothetical protein